MAAAPAQITRRTGPPQSGQVFSGSSDMVWKRSKRLPVRSHSYS
jgi:hypothetical protein